MKIQTLECSRLFIDIKNLKPIDKNIKTFNLRHLKQNIMIQTFQRSTTKDFHEVLTPKLSLGQRQEEKCFATISLRSSQKSFKFIQINKKQQKHFHELSS